MHRIIMFVLLSVLYTFSAHAQTFDEWFRQNNTQLKYLVSQIAAYEVFQSTLTQGYTIADTGLTFIGNMTGDEFDLHTNYFHSLTVVSPAVAGYSRIADIISYESAIISNFKKVQQAKN